MTRKKNYLKQHKKRYLKSHHIFGKRTLLCTFLGSILLSVWVLTYIFIDIEKETIERQNETSLVINQAVSVKKKNIRTDFNSWNQACDWNLIVVNENNITPQYSSPTLKLFGDIEIDERIIFALSEMLRDATNAGLKIWVSTGYRSFERQEQIFSRNVNDAIANGLTKDEAFREVMRETSLPGYSEHHTGLAIDFNAADIEFTETAEYSWLIEHSQNYGFILRYPQDKENITGRPFEPAHFRYVGEEHAKAMSSQNLCLEEYASSLIR